MNSIRRLPLLSRMLGFAGISAVGLGLDCFLFSILVTAEMPPAAANLVSAVAAVTLVFFASVRRIFRHQGGAVWPRYLAFIIYQVAAIASVSAAIGLLTTHTGVAALACKLVLLPATFTANYLMMGLLTSPMGARL